MPNYAFKVLKLKQTNVLRFLFMVVKHWWIKKLKIWADLKNGFDIFDSTKIRSLNDGGQNFLEKIRTKIRTFSEKSVQFVQFSKKIRTIQTIFEKNRTIRKFFFKNPYIIRTISTIFEKNPYNPYIWYSKLGLQNHILNWVCYTII